MNAAAIRVLLLEDNPDDAALVKRTLAHAGSRAFVVTHATTLATALDALRADAFEAVLADLCLLDSSSTNTVKTLVAEAPGTPVIVLTGSDSEEEEEEAMQAGAQDYLVKSESSGLLVARAIRHAVERQQLAAALQRSNLELLVANRELEAFGYTVSHDLRAPLRAIDGFSAILDEDYRDSLPAEALGHLDHLRGAAKRMNEMLTALMALSRIGSAEMLRGPVDMGLLVRECLAELAPEIGAARTDIRTGELPGCSANRPLLKQALLNLIGNAVKYSRRASPPQVSIGSERIDGAAAYFVRDNGTGFDMRHAGKLFGVFQRLHRADEYEGTGAGLAIVNRIVQRHGGRVWAEAAPDKGATFRFTLGE